MFGASPIILGVISNHQLHDVDTTILPSSFEKVVISTNIRNIVIDVLMGWDEKLQCRIPNGGLLDFCRRFLTSTKFQGFGNLHAHWLVYTHGMPTTTTMLLQFIKDPNSSIMNHLITHQTTFFQVEILISKWAICPNYDGFLQVLVLHVSTFEMPKENTCAPIIANCPTCKNCFTNEHFLRQTIIKLATSIGIHHYKMWVLLINAHSLYQ